MVLHAEKRQIPVTHAFVRVIVEIDVGDFDGARRQRFGIDAEPVILGGDFHLLVQKILYRMIRTVMAEFQFESLPAKSQTAELMAEADAEDWDPAEKLLNVFNGVAYGLGVPWAI